MIELRRENNEVFKEFYTATTYMSNGQKKTVNCILDDNCVRYVVFVRNKIKSRREFSNTQKDVCFKNATKAINK